MKNHRLLAAGLVLGYLATGSAWAADRWLHVRVEGRHDETVSINLPLSVVEAVLPTITMDELRHGKLSLDDDWSGDLEGVDLRAVLLALRDAPDAEFATVRSRDETVSVAKQDGLLLIHVEESNGGGERVQVRVPMSVVEAMVSGHSHELDLLAGLRALEAFDGEDLVRVESDDETVRIWIDSSNTES